MTTEDASSTLLTRRALETILAPLAPRDFAVRLWDGELLPAANGRPRFTLVLPHAGSLRAMLWPPGELTAAEAFVRGDFEVEGDFPAALSLRDRLRVGPGALAALVPLLFGPAAGARRNGVSQGAQGAALKGEKHSARRDADAVRHHYDLGNDFYRLWLDRRMVYSCAFFPEPGASLDDAQEAKLELLCRKLRLEKGDRLLDIGCGWGALVAYAAERYGVSAVGITLSPPQAEIARERARAAGLARRVTIEVADYRTFQSGAEPFDKLVSVGMVEHVGVAKLPAYFARAARLLRPGGLFLNHGISPLVPRDDSLRSKILHEGGFVQKYVFPDGELPFTHEMEAAATRAGLELRDVESLREHYALTLRHWLARLEASREQAIRLTSEETFRVYRLYLAGAASDFERGQNSIFQSLFVKPDHGQSGLPLTRGELHSKPLVPRTRPPRATPARTPAGRSRSRR